MNLGQVKTICRTALGRGTSLDTELQIILQESVQQLENKRPWEYMFRTAMLNYNPAATEPRKIVLDSARIRNIDFVRNVLRTQYWNAIFPTQVLGAQSGEGENAYWIENGNTLVWAYDFGQSFDFEVGYWKFTTVSEDDSFTNWLFENGGSVIIGKTLLQMSDLIRNSAVAQTYIANLSMNAAALEQLDDDLKFSNKKLTMRS